MKAIYLCKTFIQAFPEEIFEYPRVIYGNNVLFEEMEIDSPIIPKQRLEIQKIDNYKLKGKVTIEIDHSGYYWDNETQSYITFEKFYEDKEFIIIKPESFRNSEAEDTCVMETNAIAAKTLFKLINQKKISGKYPDLYLKKVEYHFPNKISDVIKEQLKGLWLDMKGAAVSKIGIFGGNVENEDRVGSLEDSAESISAVYLIYRHIDKDFMYMITKDGTVLFYQTSIDIEDQYKIAFEIYKKFKQFLSK